MSFPLEKAGEVTRLKERLEADQRTTNTCVLELMLRKQSATSQSLGSLVHSSKTMDLKMEAGISSLRQEITVLARQNQAALADIATKLDRLHDLGQRAAKSPAVLQSLVFDEFYHRELAIHEAHQTTFK
ncbi:uncharacterized protein LTR77_002005 [Saxophila tyrrhenica]|uniref:Uncharacterized protein n=1 Tax=Saxophila tyrrhenica TaxID=1690608 RepID=A0AAV9PHB6_9PEZI|nr:hypothetical protein LTR77_002005 [Saxophila tyrrhenica]